jgi:hypothetical protein
MAMSLPHSSNAGRRPRLQVIDSNDDGEVEPDQVHPGSRGRGEVELDPEPGDTVVGAGGDPRRSGGLGFLPLEEALLVGVGAVGSISSHSRIPTGASATSRQPTSPAAAASCCAASISSGSSASGIDQVGCSTSCPNASRAVRNADPNGSRCWVTEQAMIRTYKRPPTTPTPPTPPSTGPRHAETSLSPIRYGRSDRAKQVSDRGEQVSDECRSRAGQRSDRHRCRRLDAAD